MRITDGILVSESLLDQSRNAQALATVTEESATGNLVNAPSDDPTGYATLVSLDGRLSVMQGRGTVATEAANNLNVATGALSSASDLLDQAQQLAIEAASGSDDVQSRADAAAQLNGLIQQMIQLGNTKGTDGYVFGGTSTGSPPFDAAGNFTGNNGVTQVAVADGVLVNSNVSGADAFTSAGGGSNVLQDMQALSTALSTNNVPAISASISQMQADQQQVLGVMVQGGAVAATLAASSTLITNLSTATQTEITSIDSAATPEVYSELAATQTAYQTGLQVTQQILSLESFTGSQA